MFVFVIFSQGLGRPGLTQRERERKNGNTVPKPQNAPNRIRNNDNLDIHGPARTPPGFN